MRQKIAVLLDGPVVNDGRVRRVVESLSQTYSIDLFSTDATSDCEGHFNAHVQHFSFRMDSGWIKTNIAFHTKFNHLWEKLQPRLSEYTAVYCNDYPLLATAIKAKRQHTNLRVIYDSHELYIATINQFFPTSGWKAMYGLPLIAFNRMTHRKREKKLVQEVDLIITVGDCIRETMEQIWRVNGILTIKNYPKLSSIPTEKKSLHEKLQLSADAKLLLYQGALNKGRGIEKLIGISTGIDKNIHMVIVGNGPLMDHFKQLSIGKNNIHFIGLVPFQDLLSYTMDADAGVMLIQPVNKSKELALPNKLFEYMAAGIPFITNNLVESKRILQETDAGYTVNDGDTATLIADINTIFENRDLMRQKGAIGQQMIREKYNWENESSRLLKSINELLGSTH